MQEDEQIYDWYARDCTIAYLEEGAELRFPYSDGSFFPYFFFFHFSFLSFVLHPSPLA